MLSRSERRLLLRIRKDPRPSTMVGPELGMHPSRIRQLRNPKLEPGGPWPDELPQWTQGTQHRDVRGEKHPIALLTVAAVRWARRQREKHGTPYPALAEKVASRFKLPRIPSVSTIGRAVTGDTWEVVDA